MGINFKEILANNEQINASDYNCRGASNRIGISLVNSKRNAELNGTLNKDGKKANNGNRFTLSPPLVKKLGNPEEIQIINDLQKQVLYIGCKLDDSAPTYKFNPKSRVIFASGLVQGLTEKFNLDFSNRVSLSFDGKIETTDDGNCYAVINMVQRVSVQEGENTNA